MAYIEKQRHGKHDYYYAAKSIRMSAGKVRKVRLFIGRKLPDPEALGRLFAKLEKKAPKPYKALLLPKDTVEMLEDLRATALRFRKFPDEALPKDFLVRFTYNTNAIEGNPLTLRQTALILADGIAPEGTKTDDVVEALNGKDAWNFVKGYKGRMNKQFACRVQLEITKNTKCRIQGMFRNSEVGISGSDWKPPEASRVPALMDAAVAQYMKKKRSLHPVELASWLHNSIARIHPFTDGNGRTARLLMNWVLFRNRFPPVVIEVRNKEAYYKMIEAADKGDEAPFAEFLAREMLKQYTVKKEA